jgi:hypothetical protein
MLMSSLWEVSLPMLELVVGSGWFVRRESWDWNGHRPNGAKPKGVRIFRVNHVTCITLECRCPEHHSF